MKDYEVARFFMEQGWKPKYTMKERNAEVARRCVQGFLTRSEAEYEIDEEIQDDLENWVQMNFVRSELQ